MNTQIIRPPAFQRPSGKLYLSADQLNLVDASVTLVELDAIPAAYKDGIENTGTYRITPGRAGFYSIVGQVRFKNVITDKDYYSMIRISGGAFVCEVCAHASYAAAVTAKCCLPNHYFSNTDYVQLWAESFAGVDTVDIDDTEARTFLAIQRVR